MAQALSELVMAQENYRDDHFWWSQQRVRYESEISQISRSNALRHRSDDLNAFYYHTCLSKGRYFAEHYAPLRAAHTNVRAILAVHPSWADFVDASDDRSEFWIQVATSGGLQKLSSMIGGLVAHAMKVGENGFRVAATEFSALLEPIKDPEPPSVISDFSTGYHVALLHGLGVDDDFRYTITENMTLVPFGQMRDFVNESVLSNVAPSIIKFNDWKSVAAIVKPFHWKPAFAERGNDSHSSLDWGGSFFEDAQAFAELLAVFYTKPVIFLVTVPYCIHRTASCLLGRPHYHGSIGYGPMAHSFGRFRKSSPVSSHALDEAKKAFEGRTTDRYKDCAPVIARLAEALARTGRFQDDDKILDVAIALEQLYELDGGEISFKLKTRAACFLETETEGRLRVFRDVGDFYEARSSIVHRRRKHSSSKAKAEAFDTGFAVARRSVIKLLENSPPPDWNEMVVRA